MSETTYIQIIKGNKPDLWKVNAVTVNGDVHMENIAIITNWNNGGTPSIKVPYYIPNSMLDEIIKVVQKGEPPE